MLNFQSLHNLYLNDLEAKRKIEILLEERENDGDDGDVNKKLKGLQVLNLKKILKEKFGHLVDETDYILDTMHLVKKIAESGSVEEEDYENYCRTYFPKNVPLDKGGKENSCTNCGAESFVIDSKANQNSCSNCGACDSANITFPSWERTLQLYNTVGKSGYTKVKSLNECLDYILLRRKPTIDTHAVVLLKERLQYIPVENLDVKIIRNAMQQLKLNDFYCDKYYVYYILTNKKIILDPDTEKQIQEHFYLEQFAFNYLINKKVIERVNIFVYRYSLLKIAQFLLFKKQNKPLCDYTKQLQHADAPRGLRETDSDLLNVEQLKNLINIIPKPIVESEINLLKYDVSWEAICRFLGWYFIPSL